MTDTELLELLVSKFDNMEKRMEGIEGKLTEFRDETNNKFDAVDKRFDKVDNKFDAVDKRFDKVDNKFDAVDKRFDGVDKRFDALEDKLDEIEAKNATKHVELKNNILSVRRDLSRVEVNTAENWQDIARIKASI